MASPVLSAGVIIMRRLAGRPHYLLLRVYNYWDFPKGLAEKGEEPLAAALREVEEETGLTSLSFRWGRDFRETPPYAMGKVARYYVAEAEQGEVSLPVNPELGYPEHHEFRWCSYQEAREMVADRVKPILDWAHSLIGA
ncbi:MAG: bis(5'-nucleosyl)-tetraphosphatase [Thermodesulfobacteriota bacterium]